MSFKIEKNSKNKVKREKNSTKGRRERNKMRKKEHGFYIRTKQ